MTLFFNTSIDDHNIIDQIADRIMGSPHSPYENKTSAIIDLALTHALACPLNLRGLLAARDADFFHDIFGIAAHLNRTNGKFEPLFEPRFAIKR